MQTDRPTRKLSTTELEELRRNRDLDAAMAKAEQELRTQRLKQRLREQARAAHEAMKPPRLGMAGA